MVVMDATNDVENCRKVDFVFCAIDMKKTKSKLLKDMLRLNALLFNSTLFTVILLTFPMIIPEINPQHIEIIPAQRERLGTKRGFIAVKSNCSLQSYLPAMAVVNIRASRPHLITTYQAISGAGKTFKTWPGNDLTT